MNIQRHDTRFGGGVVLAVAFTLTVPGLARSDEDSKTTAAKAPTHMSEALRATVRKVVVLPSTSPVSGVVTGSYDKDTLGLLDGAMSGSRVGRGVSREIGPVVVRFPIPILTIPGAIFGGLTGGAKRTVQDFRDALTDDLANSASEPLSNDALASDVFWSIREVPGLQPKVLALTTPVPGDTEAILYVSLTDVGIDVEDNVATITTTAQTTLRRMSDGAHIYQSTVHYQDADTLSNWTKNDNTAWRDYANFARHYISREISAEVFDRVVLNHELRPAESDTIKRVKKDDWRGISKSSTPTLAWEYSALDGNAYGAWSNNIDPAEVSFDVEIYDLHELVYNAKKITGRDHTVEVELEKCKTYRWTVRPNYKVGSDVKFGEWMRLESAADSGRGGVGTQASVAAAYIQDFASLEIKCGRR